MNNYAPRPGSAAEFAIEYLRKKGGPARSGEIAREIGIETKGISAALAAAVENGVLVACDVTVPGSPPQKEYRLSGGGTPIAWHEPKPARAAAPVTEKLAEKPARKPSKPRKAPKPTPAHPRDAGRPKAAKVQRKTAKRLPVAEVPWKEETPVAGFRCGLFSSGHLEIVLRDGKRIELPPEDTRALCRYLDSMLEGGLVA